MAFSGWEYIHPGWRRRAQGLVAHFKGDLELESGHRSSERQGQLYDCWQRREPGCNPANPPGSSNHEAEPYGEPEALAIDFRIRRGSDLTWADVHEAAEQYGIHFPITAEPWHGQPDEQPLAVYTGDPFPDRRIDDDDR